MKRLSNRWSVCLRRIFTHFQVRKSLPVATSAPALSGSSAFRDEVLTFGTIGGIAVGLAISSFLGGIHRGKERNQ